MKRVHYTGSIVGMRGVEVGMAVYLNYYYLYTKPSIGTSFKLNTILNSLPQKIINQIRKVNFKTDLR